MKPLSREEILADTNGERRLIRFCRAVEAGETPSAEDLQALAAGFRGILRGDKAQNALDLTKPKGRPEATGRQVDEEFTRVQDVLFDVADRMAKGKTREIALGEVAEERGIPEETLRGWYTRHRAAVQMFRRIKKERSRWGK